MNTRSPVQWIVAILIIAAGAQDRTVFADPVHIYSADFNLPIPADSDSSKGWMIDAVINITDHITIHDIDVRVGLTHGSFFDLQIILQSPTGTNVALNLAGNLAFVVRGEDGRFTTVGGSVEMLFDDEADISIEQAAEPFTEPFRPVGSLSSFDNKDAHGPWCLQIYDRFYADIGTLNHFELIIAIPEPATAILFALGTALITLLRPHRS